MVVEARPGGGDRRLHARDVNVALAALLVSVVTPTAWHTTETLRRALGHVLEGFQHDFPVVEARRVVGVLTRADLVKGLTQNGADTPVAEVSSMFSPYLN
jgi:CBS domain-containing protein